MTRKKPIYLRDYSTTRPFCQRLLFSAVLTCVVVAADGGCANRTITSWDSPGMRKIQNEWESLHDTANNTVGPEAAEKYGLKHEKLDRMLRRIIESNLSYDALRNLTATCDTLPVLAKDRSEFTNEVLAYMERTFIDSGDRENLVKLLSTRCQLEVGYQIEIEYWLACYGEKLKDPILVLGEAFSKCKVPEVRHELARAVRRGFSGHGIGGKDDAEYVANAMQWYEKEKNRLIVNGEYWRNATHLPAEFYDEHPELFSKSERDFVKSEAYKSRMELLFKEKPPEK
jgi:hypothetical protein